MSSSSPSRIATPLQEKIALDGDWQQATLDRSESVELLIHAEVGEAAAARSHVESLGASNVHHFDDVVFADLRAERITELPAGRGVRKVEERADPITRSTSEGVSTTNADQLHSEGVTGSNVTVAIIDLQFNPDQSEIKDQVIDQIGGSSYFLPGTSGLHGTACAEIVAEMLPDADLVLASAYGGTFPSVMDDITSAHDPEVISMSLGYKPTIRLDGQDYLSNRILDYTQATGSNTSTGGVFAVSAGNDADGPHWDGPVQTDGSGYIEFDDQGSTFLQVDAVGEQSVVVQSDVDWHSNDQNYIVELYDNNQNHLQTFTKTTTPAQEVSVPTDAISYIRIKNDGLASDDHLDVFGWNPDYVDLSPTTAKRSIGIPGTCPDSETLTTAAVRHNTDELEAFSSRGPTQDGRRGVDISAPDGTQSDAYSGEFYGTSAACPHAAGAAGLLMDQSGTTNVDTREALFTTARDISDSSVEAPTNRKIGHGYVDVKAASDWLSTTISASGDSIYAGGEATISVSGGNLDEVEIADLWTDWSVVSTQLDGASFSDDISSSGSGTFSWGSTQSSLSVSLTVDIPSRYIGGDFVVTVIGRNDGTPNETTATISIS